MFIQFNVPYKYCVRGRTKITLFETSVVSSLDLTVRVSICTFELSFMAIQTVAEINLVAMTGTDKMLLNVIDIMHLRIDS